MDFFPYPFFQFVFEVIRCLRFFYIFWYHVVQLWSKVGVVTKKLINIKL